MTDSLTASTTITETEAVYIASKVAADLLGMRAYYEWPNETEIWEYYLELAILLSEGCLESVEYGFEQNDQRVFALFYESNTVGLTDARSGGVYAKVDVSGATPFSFLTYGGRWDQLTDEQKQQIEERLPIKRTFGQAPLDDEGRWVTDRAYSSQGTGTQRRTFLPH